MNTPPLAISRIPSTLIKPLNFLLLQAGWWAGVLSAAEREAWLGVLVITAIVALHVMLSDHSRAEFKLVLAAVAIGLLWDSLLIQAGWIVYAPTNWPAALAPLWILAMWAGFATTLNVSLNWLHGRYWLAALFGAIGGPLSYWAGAELGAAHLAAPLPALTALTLGWAVITPLLLHVAASLYAHDPVHTQAWRKLT